MLKLGLPNVTNVTIPLWSKGSISYRGSVEDAWIWVRVLVFFGYPITSKGCSPRRPLSFSGKANSNITWNYFCNSQCNLTYFILMIVILTEVSVDSSGCVALSWTQPNVTHYCHPANQTDTASYQTSCVKWIQESDVLFFYLT